jgi:hypothetical protein
MISVPCEGFELHEWWKTENGWAAVLGEYFKLAFYAIRYGYGGVLLLSFFLGWGVAVVYFRYFGRKTSERGKLPISAEK